MSEKKANVEMDPTPPSLERMVLGVAAELGFMETDEMKSVRESMDITSADQTDPTTTITTYVAMTEDLSRPAHARRAAVRLDAGKLLARAAMTYRSGFHEDAYDYLTESHDLMINLEEKEIEMTIDALIKAFFPSFRQS